jgi:hypothetical protein
MEPANVTSLSESTTLKREKATVSSPVSESLNSIGLNDLRLMVTAGLLS